MPTGMTEKDWALGAANFAGCALAPWGSRTRRSAVPGGGALLHGQQHPLTRLTLRVRALEHGLEALLASLTKRNVGGIIPGAGGVQRTSGLIQMFDCTSIRAHVSAAGAKGGRKIRCLDAHVAGSARKSMSKSTATAIRSTFI